MERAAPADESKLEILRQWAATIEDGSINDLKETALHGSFKQRIVCDVLGYTDFNESGEWSVDVETNIGAGSVDLALGHFTAEAKDIIAPFELKGAKTKNLDAIMPGRAKSPVDQAWEYASNNVGSKWVLVSNYLEIRLYSYADGRQFHETFDLAKLHQPQEYKRFMLLLSADSLLSGGSAQLLEESRAEDRDITNALYSDYKELRANLIGAVQQAKPDIDPLEAISVGQTILDRVLFIAFAEDNGLLPDNSLLKAFAHNDPYNPRPVWENFRGLFAAIDQGSEQLNIPRYNGGLFVRDPVIRSLAIPDHICEGFKRLAEYDFASEVPVTILGRIFEQSISDIETLQKQARGEAVAEKKSKGTSGRQKRDGVVYTPDYIARFIVEQTLGTHCREIFDGILAEYAAKGAGADDEEIKWKRKGAEKEAWAAYRERLTSLRIVDPACGSGVFLVIAFDWMKAELERVNERLASLDGAHAGDLFDPDSEILTNNLFGVDVNHESVEIAKLSLWIKTARRGKVLDSLDGNLRVGDSLIEDSSYAYREEGFVWKEAFPDVFAQGGFDIVLGNPPYVRQELLKALKPYLKSRFAVYHGVADLYAYFFERGLRLLKPGGRLGYISSATFFKTAYGKPLREFLRTQATLETIVDFGDNQIFEGVTTYPAILTMRAGAPEPDHHLQFWNIEALPKGSFDDGYRAAKAPYPQSTLPGASWQLEAPELRALRTKIVQGRKTLKEVYGSPLYGIKTGRNEAFVIDRATRDRLVAEDPKSAEVLKPWLEGKDIKRWRAESRDLWLILFERGWTNETFGTADEDLQWERLQAHYPAIAAWLEPHAQACRKRTDKGEFWWELRACSYYQQIEAPKIIYGEFSSTNLFHASAETYFNNKCYFIASDSSALLAYLNSRVFWTFALSQGVAVRGGFVQMHSQFMEQTPLPLTTAEAETALGKLAEAAQNAAEERYRLEQSITRRIPDLADDPAAAKLSTRLKQWWLLPDFAAFQKEVKKTLKADIPLKERSEWEDWISQTRSEITALTAEITRLEAEINTQVYALFDLTQDEIALLEANI
ncbi:Eco57I restriction-modification methylase domain-containing protein [Alterisphingorhabdus coralli]|uniref:site-specific DNA-methyltransferase (adenine-specific) n=1 Tax=Alterisphingorhabdus coralli TaxID=3071408 RepID=A0AA97F8X4_9SPHN|nr:DNA methyltransferase [Parasphingorhabdus sp. SCSIO 66989]WOE76066.1 DNA methyltransferase [Parasphingorhabdus sp. SCSIO 66989]